MKKNQKILVAVLAIVIVLAVVIFAIAMNKNTDEETSSSSNVETSEVVSTSESTKVESSTEVIASIGTAPEDSQSSIDKSGAINFPGSESSESSTSESTTSETSSTTESSTTESTTESTTSKTETSTSETSTSNSSTSKTETSTSETSTSTEPTTSESSTSTTVPDNSSSTPSTPAGEQITQGSTGTTSLGTTYPIVSEFNKLGLNPNYDNFFSSDGMSTDFSKAFGQADRSLSDVLGYPSEQFAISATNTYISYGDAHISRKPENGYYVFVYAANIVDTSDGGASSRAAHQVMLGAITSTPAEVEQALFESTFTAPNGQEPINLSTGVWTTIGDCQIRYNGSEITDSNFTVEYAIRPLN